MSCSEHEHEHFTLIFYIILLINNLLTSILLLQKSSIANFYSHKNASQDLSKRQSDSEALEIVPNTATISLESSNTSSFPVTNCLGNNEGNITVNGSLFLPPKPGDKHSSDVVYTKRKGVNKKHVSVVNLHEECRCCYGFVSLGSTCIYIGSIADKPQTKSSDSTNDVELGLDIASSNPVFISNSSNNLDVTNLKCSSCLLKELNKVNEEQNHNTATEIDVPNNVIKTNSNSGISQSLYESKDACNPSPSLPPIPGIGSI